MGKKNLILSGLFSLISMFIFSQTDLSVNKSFTEAMAKETRTLKGIPGKNYWQNSASYDIDVEIIPSEKKLIGAETITYQNNSPDSLKYLVFHVFQNLYKKGSQRDAPVDPDDITDGVTIDNLKIRNKVITDFNTRGTLVYIKLEEPIVPSESINIELSWNFLIPSKSDIRMGGKDDTSFFLGQWYPKIAVYDDLDGWDLNVHTGGQEFYYDLGDYKYSVKVPEGYMVWGTGMLQNAETVLSTKVHAKYLKAQKSDSIISIVGLDDYNSGSAITQSNVWEFQADRVADVAFGLSNHFLWDGTSLSGVTDKNIFVEAAYPSEAKDFTEVALLAKKSVHYFSTELPGYPFPFPKMTVFNGTNGNSGMEYTMIVNNPSADNRGRTVDVTAHEIAHNYFPYYVLTNETKHAWMDEAFASMIPYKYQLENGPSLGRLIRSVKHTSDYANTDMNVASNTISVQLKGQVSYFNNYEKPAVALYVLQDMLGEKLFKECLLTYLDIWKGKHPTPLDFFNLVNEVSQKNLTWFWQSWFYENHHPDLMIEQVEQNKTGYALTINKIGALPVPIVLNVIFDDESTAVFYHSAAIWQDKNAMIIPIETNKKIKSLKLGNEYIPDTDSKNNIFPIE